MEWRRAWMIKDWRASLLTSMILQGVYSNTFKNKTKIGIFFFVQVQVQGVQYRDLLWQVRHWCSHRTTSQIDLWKLFGEIRDLSFHNGTGLQWNICEISGEREEKRGKICNCKARDWSKAWSKCQAALPSGGKSESEAAKLAGQVHDVELQLKEQPAWNNQGTDLWNEIPMESSLLDFSTFWLHFEL